MESERKQYFQEYNKINAEVIKERRKLYRLKCKDRDKEKGKLTQWN